MILLLRSILYEIQTEEIKNILDIFLDADMHQHSLKESNVMRLNGFKTHVILSKCDPKEYTYNELKEIL